MAQDPNQWTQEDAANLRLFLKQNPKFLRILKNSVPKIEGKSNEERLITANEHKGAEDLLDVIEAMNNPLASPEPEAGFIATGD